MLKVHVHSKKYGNNFTLADVAFTLAQKECLCLIGANGSGKTTLINCLLGLTDFQGKVIYGEQLIDPLANPQAFNSYRQEVAYISDTTNLFEFLTPSEYIDLLVLGADGTIDEQLFFALLDIFKITHYKNTRISELSFGTKKKMQIILQIIRRPKYIIFDEPTNGLDPEMLIILKIIIQQFLSKTAGVLLSTHQLGFCKDLGTKVILLQDGRAILVDSMHNLAEKYGTDDLEVVYKDLNADYYQKVGETIANLKY